MVVIADRAEDVDHLCLCLRIPKVQVKYINAREVAGQRLYGIAIGSTVFALTPVLSRELEEVILRRHMQIIHLDLDHLMKLRDA